MKFLFSGLLVLSLFMVSLSAPQKEEEEPAEPVSSLINGVKWGLLNGFRLLLGLRLISSFLSV